MKSIWNDIKKQKFEALDGDIKTDVLIIGGGLCGILCAYMLNKAGVDCVLAEANEILSGVTNGTTAKITLGHGLIYSEIIKKYGIDKASGYYESQMAAFNKLTKLALGFDCDFEYCDSFVYSLKNRAAIEKEIEALSKIGCKSEFTKETELPFEISGAVKINKQAQFHPLKFAYSIAKDLKIYENTKILGIESGTAIAEKGNIKAEKIIVATHFPFIDKHGGYFLKMYQHRSYVLALENANSVKNMYVDEAKDGLSFRNHNGLLLLGGGSHRTGCKGGGWQELKKFKEKYYPDAKLITEWATQDCMTLDSICYIGNYSKLTPNLFVATGFNKWGMTSSMVSAIILKDLVCGKKNEYADIYSPSRSIFHPQLAVNLFESSKNLLTPKTPRCTHLGCALKYNKEEHTWDCPCHGSRFSENGKLIDNPATRDINELK